MACILYSQPTHPILPNCMLSHIGMHVHMTWVYLFAVISPQLFCRTPCNIAAYE